MFTSLPNLSKASLRAARRWHLVEEALTDEQALATGIITPEMLEFIMQIVMTLLGCMSNSPRPAIARIRAYGNAKPMERFAENLFLNASINKWATSLGIPREPGDVVMIRNAVTEVAIGLKDKEFVDIQNEVLAAAFITI